jgi:TRAP-type C4-dicarboxylate transport system permease small subunit
MIFKRLDSIVNAIIENMSNTLLFLMFFVVMLEVISRYVMKTPFFWTDELARYLMFYMVMFGSSIALREERHPALLFIIEKFPKKIKNLWFIIVDVIISILLIIIFKEGLSMAIDALNMKTPALRIPFFWVYLALPIGSLLMLYQIATKYIYRFMGERNK